MENFEKCTVAMLGGPCSQHVTGNTSRQNQSQSAIMWIEAHIQCINANPNRYNALVPAIVRVTNDVTIPDNSTTS